MARTALENIPLNAEETVVKILTVVQVATCALYDAVVNSNFSYVCALWSPLL